jgi:MoxR-like ATPase
MAVRPAIIAQALRHMRDSGISLYVHGAPGISKSAVARQVADEFGIAFIDFRLTSVAPEDIRGVPFVNDAGGISGLVWTPPLIFPRDLDLVGMIDAKAAQIVKFYNPVGNNGIHYCTAPVIEVACVDPGKTAHLIEQKPDRFVVVVKDTSGNVVPGSVLWNVTGTSKAIFGLEEFNSAPPTVMAAAYQLILDRRVGDYIVPDGVMLVAMGNRDGDKGVTYKIPKPVANRFVHLEMEINSEDWQEWAVKNNIHSDVIGYLAKWTSHLFEEKFAEKPEHAFATPRSWEFVSKIISKADPKTDEDRAVRMALVCGAIGNVIGTAFMIHKEFMDDMPNVQHIFSGRVTTFNPKNDKYKTQIAYSTCIQLCYELKKESDIIDRLYKGDALSIKASPERVNYCEKADNAIGYAMTNFAPEVMVVFQRMAFQIYKLRFDTKNMKNFKVFAEQHRNTILS